MRFRHDCSQFIGPDCNSIPSKSRQYIPKNGGITTDFEYSAAGARVRRVRGEQEIVYLGDVYEHETNGNTITERIYVSNNERVVAIAERINSAETWQFVHTDHLGSVDAISDAAGNEIERRSFDAWGAPRNPKWGNPAAVANGNGTRRGFTWHESDDEVGLVNAKGRLYDPKRARFLQVDPVISEPLDAQTHNPYSYVRNRPLVFTDPSGFTEEEAWRLWRADETGPLGLHITYDKLTPPGPRPHFEPRAPAPPSTAEAAPSTADKAAPAAMTSGDKLVAGVGDGVVELMEHADEMVPGSLAELGATFRLADDIAMTVAKGETVDAINKVNPLMGVTRLGFAIDEEDWYPVGRESVGVGVTIVMAVVAKKAGGGKGGSLKGSQNTGVGPKSRYVPIGPDGEPLALPRGPNGELVPSSMDPHSQIGWREGRRGGYVQTREFGANGEALKQVDWTDHGRPGHTDPHIHDYLPNPTGGTPQHGPARPPLPGEL